MEDTTLSSGSLGWRNQNWVLVRGVADDVIVSFFERSGEFLSFFRQILSVRLEYLCDRKSNTEQKKKYKFMRFYFQKVKGQPPCDIITF